jgi:hypothetical protein
MMKRWLRTAAMVATGAAIFQLAGCAALDAITGMFGSILGG